MLSGPVKFDGIEIDMLASFMADLPPDLPLFPPDPSAPPPEDDPPPPPASRRAVTRAVGIFLLALMLCFLLIHFGREYGPKARGSLRLANIVVNLTPTFLSILFAFVVDKDLEDRMKWRWLFRIFVVSCGLGLSGMLWHQQTLADIQSQNQINKAVSDAVEKANKHSDDQFKASNQHVGTLENKVDGVNQQQVALAQDFAKATGDIDTHLGKVGKPDPTPPATLEVTLWDASASAENQILNLTIQPNSDGNYSVDFTIINSGQSAAETVDVWIQVCRACSFVKQPDGFAKTAGSDDTITHMQFNLLNPGVNISKQTMLVKSLSTDGFFQIAFHYSCKTCGGKISANQIATVVMGAPPLVPPTRQ
jgi:hypothetical protein